MGENETGVMKRELEVVETLVYNDYPQVWIGYSLGNLYLCVAIPIEEHTNIYWMAVQITDFQKLKLKKGEVDLRTLFENPIGKQWYRVRNSHAGLIYDPFPFEAPPEEYMPEPGFYFKAA